MKQKIIDYIQNLPIPDNFKLDILDEYFSNNNPIYYQNYPCLFASVYFTESKTLELLNIAGYLYYHATLIMDAMIDEKDTSKFPILAICQEESVKILTSVFGLESDFWLLWNSRRNEYLEAIYLEKNLFKKDFVSIEEYETLADKKAAFGKVAIDCLYSLDSKDKNLYKQLLLSHKYFSVAFQLNDDIQDFKEDLKSRQFNWAVYLLERQDIKTGEPEILEKYLYIKGVSKEIYLLGISYCDKALHVVGTINTADWKKVIQDTKKRFIIAISELDNYLEVLITEISLSKLKETNNNIQSSISKAILFLKNTQNEDGSWREYINQGGISSTWATAFITSKISENDLLKNLLENEIAKAIDFLETNPITNIWSYNTTWIEDADSTNFVMLSFCLNQKLINSQVVKEWLKFQGFQKGFSTYNNGDKLLKALDDKNINDVSGWLGTHHCVSAVSFYFLVTYYKNEADYIKIKDYFETDFGNKLNSYWWTSEIYTLYYLAKTYNALADEKKMNFLINQIKEKQNKNGSFSDKYGENLFYTGLALEILLLKAELFTLEIENSVEYILKNQYEDGSWDNSHALQVPNSSILEPEGSHYEVASFGMDVRAKEFSRLFTTSTILQALSSYEHKYSTPTFG
ncbi:prenyltransferase/squalene oxidase repeat-containing protein [Flavobacterium taihuense]|uniref:Squalene cyclase C-terminal domain-containing protein n=1 Tax=Flavobacterium taihuense TaxID=2857508 RepID=A0ABS6XX63_9FLAO|nr:prenyltransferase/squalene oxidase repeat-containing protein [Flavobacterium taihuense]MBW4361242.1 hypothetical protein [Flavobacterium taihuense]